MNSPLSPFSKIIGSSGELLLSEPIAEGRTPRIQSSLGLEPRSDGSWTSSIISPPGMNSKKDTLEIFREDKRLPSSVQREDFTKRSENVGEAKDASFGLPGRSTSSESSPERSSPVFEKRRRRPILNLKRRRLKQCLDPGNEGGSSEKIHSAEDPVPKAVTSSRCTAADLDRAELKNDSETLDMKNENELQLKDKSNEVDIKVLYAKDQDSASPKVTSDESPLKLIGRRVASFTAENNVESSLQLSMQDIVPGNDREVKTEEGSPDLKAETENAKKERLELARERKRSWRRSWLQSLENKNPNTPVLTKESPICKTMDSSKSEQSESESAKECKIVLEEGVAHDGNSPLFGSNITSASYGGKVFKHPFIVDFLRKNASWGLPCREGVSKKGCGSSIAGSYDNSAKTPRLVGPGPSLGMRRKSSSSTTLSGMVLKSVSTPERSTFSRPFVSPFTKQSEGLKPDAIRGLGTTASLTNRSLSLGLTKKQQTPKGLLDRSRTCGDLNECKSVADFKSTAAARSSASKPMAATKRTNMSSTSCRPTTVKTLSKAKNIFGDDFESFMKEVEQKGGMAFSPASKRLAVDPMEKAKSIFGSDFDSLQKESPGLMKVNDEQQVNSENGRQDSSTRRAHGSTISDYEKELIVGRVSSADGSMEASLIEFSGVGRPMGFSTGSGKPLSISAAAMSKAKALFGCLENVDAEFLKSHTDETSSSVDILKTNLAPCEGVKTPNILSGCVDNTVTRKMSALQSKAKLQSTEVLNCSSRKGQAFSGFTTATGKSVVVSEKGLLAAKTLFGNSMDAEADVNRGETSLGFEAKLQSTEDLNYSNRRYQAFSGFTTATGKSVIVSEKGLLAAKTLFGNNMDAEADVKRAETSSGFQSLQSTESIQVQSTEVLNYSSKKDKAFSGFTTAAGKSVVVSGKGLLAARTLFNDKMDTETDVNVVKSSKTSFEAKLESTEVLTCGKEQAFSGFTTGTGKSLVVSEKGLLAAKALFKSDTIDVDSDFVSDIRTCPFAASENVGQTIFNKPEARSDYGIKEEKTFESEFGGFSTASGKSVAVSEKGLNAARTLFNSNRHERIDIMESSSTVENAGFLSESIRHSRNSSQSGLSKKEEFSVFNTASGKLVTVSETSVSAARVLTNTDNDSSIKDGVQAHDTFTGFTTGHGDLMTVSSESVERARSIFGETCSKSSGEPTNLGFTTGRGTPISVSLKSVESARKIFGDDYDGSLNSDLTKEKELAMEETPLAGFKTGSGTRILISSKSMNRAKDMFKDDVSNLSNPDEKDNPSVGFKTGAGTPILISSRSMDRVKTIFKEEMNSLSEAKAFTPDRCAPKVGSHFTPVGVRRAASTVRKSIFSGFQTASGRKVDMLDIKADKLEGKAAEDDGKEKDEFDQFGDNSQDLALIEEFALNDPTSTPVSILNKRRAARQVLRNNISLKSEVAPIAGKLYLQKKERTEIIKLRSLLKKDENAGRRCMTSFEASQFVFRAWEIWEDFSENVEGYIMADGGQLILSDYNTVGASEITDAFYSTPGVDPKLISNAWIANHYKWIVQKLHWMDKMVKDGKLLTPENILLQLKYRYDREIDRAERPCLKKILEQDDVPSKAMVLLVADIVNTTRLELSDGWYSIWGSLDATLQSAVRERKIVVGTKLIMIGSLLTGAPEPCDPLQKTGTEALKISSNSCRLAPWDAKLGYQNLKEPPPLPIRCIRKDGGQIQRIRCIIARVYPVLYLVKKDGVSTTLNARMHENLIREFEISRRSLYDKIRMEVEKDMIDGDYREPHKKRRRTIPSEEDLHQLQLRRDEIEQETRKRLEEENRQAETIPMIRLRIVDVSAPETVFSLLLTFWRPPADGTLVLKEGGVFDMFKLNPSATSGTKPWEISLNTGRGTVLRPVQMPPPQFRKRTFTPISATYDEDFVPDFCEMDTVGYVALIEGDSSNYQIVVLSDGCDAFLYLKFWMGIKHYGWDKMVKQGAVLAVSNIQWRLRGSILGAYRCGFCTESTTFSERSSAAHLIDPLMTLEKHVQAGIKADINQSAEKQIEEFLKAEKRWRSIVYQTPRPASVNQTFVTPGSSKLHSRPR